MKKLIATALVLLTCGAVYALPVGNPSEASLFTNGAWCESTSCDPCDPCFSWCDSWSIRLGFAGDYVFNRHMKANNRSGGIVDTTTIHTNAGYVALNICDRLDIFTRLGASQLNIESNTKSLDLASEFQFSTDFAWSLGARATLWECNCFAIGVEGEYFQTNSDINLYTDNGGNYIPIDGVDTAYREWQVGLGASYRFATNCPTFAMVPYLAVKWSGSKLDMNGFVLPDDGGVVSDLKNDKDIGYAVGVSFTMCDMIGVTVEGRFADEKAVYVNGQFRF